MQNVLQFVNFIQKWLCVNNKFYISKMEGNQLNWNKTDYILLCKFEILYIDIQNGEKIEGKNKKNV